MRTERATCTVATYNIHRCIGSDGRKDPERIGAILRELSCDIVGLQEVESHGPRGGEGHQLDYLAREGGYDAVPGPTMESPEGHYGNALLTRAPVLEVQRHTLGTGGQEPRGALETTVEVRGIAIRAIVTHLGLGLRERRDQVARILEIVGVIDSTPTILLGDFNEWIPWARSRRGLRAHFGKIPMPATFPSKRPLLALDQIMVHPASALKSLHSVRTPVSRVASDHLPLRAFLDFRGAPSR